MGWMGWVHTEEERKVLGGRGAREAEAVWLEDCGMGE
jgi:hypothetical protein